MTWKLKTPTLYALLLFAAVFSFSSCAQIKHAIDTNPLLIDRAVERATVEYIGGDVEKAQRVVEVVTTLRQAADADQDVSTDAIVSTLKAKIKWDDLSIAQQAALGGVLIAVENDLRDRQRSDALVNVRRLLDVIIAAAESET